MPALNLSEIADPKLLALPKYAIGERVRVVRITLHKNDAPDTKEAFLAALGQEFAIKEVVLWEMEDPENPYVTYEIDVTQLMKSLGSDTHGEFIYLTADEIEPATEDHNQ